MTPRLLLVLPCYNEEAILHLTDTRLNAFYDTLIRENRISRESRICYVNDGSRDATWEIIEALAATNPRVLGVKLSRNFGHQNALLAGLFEYKGLFDCYISIDADLQDDLNAIIPMIEKYNEGASIVYGVRDDRSTDTFFKKFTAETFYKLMRWLKVPVVFNHADFRLIDNRVLTELENYREVNMFIRGIIPTIGLKNDKVYYKRLEREAGETKYPLGKMLTFAWNGITSFSIMPMRFVLWFGAFSFLLSGGMAVYVLYTKFVGVTTAGWASTLLMIAFFNGSNMLAIGLIGEYMGKIYEEVKARPRYIVEKSSPVRD
ncbi:MAG: glycosyltransferase family 2 protein [Leadbetterella sp.]|nr:glycosyltransferase family 2 protein [Leadbetterella sp.]